MWRHDVRSRGLYPGPCAEGVLCAVAIIHVDDFLLIHRSDFKQLSNCQRSTAPSPGAVGKHLERRGP
eukprot:3417794-Amphidinium_carterae.1